MSTVDDQLEALWGEVRRLKGVTELGSQQSFLSRLAAGAPEVRASTSPIDWPSLTAEPADGAVLRSGRHFLRADIFVTSGTWTKPDNVTFVEILVIGGGGGGGAGFAATGGAAGSGGGGGGGGGCTRNEYLASELPDTLDVFVGSGGGPGVDGVHSYVGPSVASAYAFASPGTAGQDADAVSAGFEGLNGTGLYNGTAGGVGGLAGGAPAAPGDGEQGHLVLTGGAACGGGGGGRARQGGADATDGGTGGVPASYILWPRVPAGTAGALANGGNGTDGPLPNGTTPRMGGFGGGGGGGARNVASVRGGNGGNGSIGGGGGGGGGASVTAGTPTAGVGGSGGTGMALIVSW